MRRCLIFSLRWVCFRYFIDLFLTYPVVVCAVHVTWHAKVTDFDYHFVADQTVSGRQVSVYKMLGCQVFHSVCDLIRDVKQFDFGQRLHEYCTFAEEFGVGPMTSKTNRPSMRYKSRTVNLTWHFKQLKHDFRIILDNLFQ